MPASYVDNGGFVGSASGVTTITPPLPSSLNVSDLLIASLWLQGNATPATPSGWTPFASKQTGSGSCAHFFKYVTGGDTAPVITWSGSMVAAAVVSRFIGVNPISPIGTVGAIAADSVLTRYLYAPQAIVTEGANSLVATIDLCSIGTPCTTSNGWTENANLSDTHDLDQFNLQSIVVPLAGATAGPTIYDGGSAPWMAVQFEILSGAESYINNTVFDQGLNYIRANATTLYLCVALPTDYASIAALSIGSFSPGAGNLFVGAAAASSPSGRQITSIAATNVAITVTGRLSFWVAADDVHSALLAGGAMQSPQIVENSSIISLAPVTVRMPNIGG